MGWIKRVGIGKTVPGPGCIPTWGGGDGDPHHGLVDGVRRFVREDAGGEAGDHLLHPALVGRVQDVVVDVDVSPLGTERERNLASSAGGAGGGTPKSSTLQGAD